MSTLTLEQQLQPDVIAAARGDRQAFARLVDASRGAVCAIALATTRDVATSEDIAQEVFLAAWRNLPRLRNPSSFLPYLRQTTRNLAHSQWRSAEQRHRVDDADAQIAAAVDAAPGIDEHLSRTEHDRALAEVIDALNDESREVITLYYREGESTRHVANLLGLREATVRKRLSRAREQIRVDLLARFADAARASTPGVAFTALVLTALGTASQPAAAAASMSIAAGAGKSVLAKLAAGIGAAFIGVGFGVGSVILGLRRHFREARDERTHRDLRRLRAAAIVLMIVTASLFGPNPWVQGWQLPVFGFVTLISGLAVLYLYLLPKILRETRAAQLRDDPAAAARHRRERVYGWLGWFLGAAAGGTALFVGLRNAGLI